MRLKGEIGLTDKEKRSVEVWLGNKILQSSNPFHNFFMDRYMKTIISKKAILQAKHGLLTGLFNGK